MDNPQHSALPKISPAQYGSALIEEQVVPCCLGSDLMVYIPIAGVCKIVGLDADQEIERIRNHRALRQGLALVPFQYSAGEGAAPQSFDFPSISLTRLHAWLNLVPPETVQDEEMSRRLSVMQEQLADLIYAYMGRPMLPEEVRVEREQHLPQEQKDFYAALEEVSQVKQDLSLTRESVEQVDRRVKTLEMALSLRAPDGSFIDKKQQVIYRDMVAIVGKLYQDRGNDFEEVEKGLKEEFGFIFYKVITVEEWEPIVRRLISMYKLMTRPGTPLPKIFEDALKLKPKPPAGQQNRLF